MRVWEPYVTGGRQSPEDLKVPWGCRAYRKALRLLDLLSDLPSRVDTVKTSCGFVADFLDRALQIFRDLCIFRYYTTCKLLDL